MRLSCQKAFLVLLVSAIGCDDNTGPLAFPAQFQLENINGRQLPTYFAPTPGPTKTILSASLFLDNAGQALMVEHRREFDGAESIVTNTSNYTIRGNQIEINSFEPCPINSIFCIGTVNGTISGQTLSLSIVEISPWGGIVYNYRIASSP
jgi:hypothetical protein